MSFLSIFFSSAFFLATVFWPFSPLRSEEIKKTQLEIPADLRPYQILRVLVNQDIKELMIEIDAAYDVYDGEGRFLFSGSKMESTAVTALDAKIKLGPQFFSRLPITVHTKSGVIKAGKRSYRGGLTFWPDTGGEMAVINEINIEDYLRGVLPWEASPKWAIEALKAQAVASRTYALFQAIDRADELFDLYSGVASQVYKGQGIENRETDLAIADTKGQILSYNGKIFSAFYHSTCGGATTRAEAALKVEPHPVLQGVTCGFCRSSKHYRWSDQISEPEILKAIGAHGYKFPSLDRFEGINPDASGRFQQFLVGSGGQSATIRSNDFRLWMGPEKLKSTKITSIQRQGSEFAIQGHGWGHGVGVCQYGMKNLAELGYTYRQILDYYYPGSYIVNTDR